MADTAPNSTIGLQAPSPGQIDAFSSPPAADITTPKPKPKPKPHGPSRFQKLNNLYALPAPLRTFPLPTFTLNPLSALHILYLWLRQTTRPESSSFVYEGWFSPETRSVHVTDHRSIRGLWEQGFYGKGSLSRSEPSWMEREKTRQGTKKAVTSEEVTAQRRLERQQVKWERARKAREAIEQTLSEEAEAESIGALPDSFCETKEVECRPPVSSGLGETVATSSSNAEVLEVSSTVVMNGSAKTSLAKSPKYITSPVGPLELLSLPNSSADSGIDLNGQHDIPAETSLSRGDATLGLSTAHAFHRSLPAPVGPLQLLALPNSSTSQAPMEIAKLQCNDHVDEPTATHVANSLQDEAQTRGDPNTNGNVLTPKLDESNRNATVGGFLDSVAHTSDDTSHGSEHSEEYLHANGTSNGTAHVNGGPSTPTMKRQKSVRFSPTIEQTTFIQSEPPSPARSVLAVEEQQEPPAIKEQEHTQLTLEEAFFLSYALGALTILDPATRAPIPRSDLLQLFRRTSHFPPLANPSLAPDDPFMVNYVVYHNYRSLGWVPRPGIKFSCDFMLYNRGPVFDHADFGLIILPSYSHAYWSSDAFLQNYVKGKQNKTWHWLMCINRVIAQVKKTLVLCYVDVPPPLSPEEEAEMGVDGVLRRYKIREVVLSRFMPNRIKK